jgi:hypothetical protein
MGRIRLRLAILFIEGLVCYGGSTKVLLAYKGVTETLQGVSGVFHGR